MIDEQHNPWKVLSEKVVYDNPWIRVHEYNVINPSGGRGIYGTVRFKNTAIGILPLDSELNTYLVGQFRFSIDCYTWEIPEGGAPEGEDPIECAKRELLEETGLEASEWKEFMKIHTSDSVTDECGIVFIARGLAMKEAQPEETEQLSVRKVSLDEAVQMVNDGRITDSISVAALLKAKLMLLNGQLQ
jgi:8-oxo-dGTP pyrophosphatase MutT (NUDIX family)